MKKYITLSLYEVSKCYEHFYTKTMPDTMAYVKALKMMLADFGSDKVLAFSETLPKGGNDERRNDNK